MSMHENPDPIDPDNRQSMSSSKDVGPTVSSVKQSEPASAGVAGLSNGVKLGTVAALGIALTAVPSAKAQGTAEFSDTTGTGDPGDPGGPVACDANPDPGPTNAPDPGPIPDSAGGHSDPHGAPADPGGQTPSGPAPSDPGGPGPGTTDPGGPGPGPGPGGDFGPY